LLQNFLPFLYSQISGYYPQDNADMLYRFLRSKSK
jgi:hypothetical protein